MRLVLGAAGVISSVVPLRRDRVGTLEARVFRAVNGLPDSLFVPAWLVMQMGTLGAAPVAAAAAYFSGNRPLASRLLTAGTTTWALSKVVKRAVRRGRPRALLPDTRCRGREAAGLGYLSGHAGVAVALGVAALPFVAPRARPLVIATIPTVGLSRMYVGAHLPLDVLGGAALGLAVDAAVSSRRRPGTATRSGA